ncbi:universal stress protein [Conexibacter sp. CPCC 206217]|uniref:universal stress protein n=1 Tax=Conexibacter sp. CPCC 206217 TaxID=3064574 RepID=UPI00271EBB63|nr:universal stress protein [Conexibacter sp. CPCC 206217]MDO8212557.1 universal stress protein [Conexibacter sp. CPCC 206217]
MHKILIGYDGSSRGEDALALGRVLADAVETPTVVVANVYDALIPKNGRGEPSLREQRLQAEAEELLDGVRRRLPDAAEWGLRAVRGTSPSAGLHRLASEGDFDVIVVGASHRHGLGRIFGGSATEQTLMGSPRAVAVAPPGYADRAGEGALRRIGLAYDGSTEARQALALAAELARGSAAMVVAIDVADTVGPPLVDAYGYGSYADDMLELASQHLDGAERELWRHGIERIEIKRPEGRAAHELIAATEQLDLLVLGSRSHGPSLRVLLGSVSTAVVRDAACPVLLHPRSAAPDEPAAASDHAHSAIAAGERSTAPDGARSVPDVAATT